MIQFLQVMEEEIQQILRKSNKQGQKIAINNLRHRPRTETKVVDEQTLSKLKNQKKYVFHDTSIPSQTLNHYYCSLCGRIVLVTNVMRENMPRRKTDRALAVDLRGGFVKLNLQRDKIRYITREKGLQTYYRWKCQCGLPVGYCVMTYQQFQLVRQGMGQLGQGVVARPYFYVFEDALVQKMRESKLLSELITYKQTILLHLKRKTKK